LKKLQLAPSVEPDQEEIVEILEENFADAQLE
jgi:hypothetical protein